MTAQTANDSIVPGFVLGPAIGKGGFAVVHRATQISLDREVAIKIDSRITDDERNARRFLREATASSLISSHPHVVSLIDAGTTADKRPYLAMELCEGGSVAKLVKARGPLRPADVNEIGIAIASALAAAHERGILHRDIKPANILIDGYGMPRLGDFGLAALPTPGEELSVTLEALTPAFASPETFERAVPSAAADVWSLGATLYAILTGHAPRRNPDGSAMTVTDIIKRLDEPLPAPTHIIAYAQPLMNVLWRATAVSPEQRPSAESFRQQLVALRGHLGPGRDLMLTTDVTRISPELSRGMPLTPASARTMDSGLSPATAGPGTPAPLAPVPARRRWWMPLAAAAAVALLAVGVAAGYATGWFGLATSGEPDEGESPVAVGELPWVVPAVGMCYGPLLQGEEGVGAESVGCDEQHHWESFATGTLRGEVSSVAPADVKSNPAVLEACTEAVLEEYTDVALSRLTIEVLAPTPERFEGGERRFSCIASTGPRVGSIGR